MFLPFLKKNLFTFGCAGSSLRQAGVFSSCGARASRCGGFSCYGARSLRLKGFSSCGSRVLENRLSNCGMWAQLHCGKGDLPRPGVKSIFPALAGGFFTTEPPGKPVWVIFFFFAFYRLGFMEGSLIGPEFQSSLMDPRPPTPCLYSWLPRRHTLPPASEGSQGGTCP